MAVTVFSVGFTVKIYSVEIDIKKNRHEFIGLEAFSFIQHILLLTMNF
jgi:hypothetical protein